jgi:phage terminase large subunit GpA-like protein
MRSDSVRIVIADELDGMGITKGGDPKALLAKRQNTFKETAKMCLSSTPLNDGIITDYLEASTYRKFYVPCPHCGEMMTFEMETLHWEVVGDGVVKDAWMVCPSCHGIIRNEDKLGMMEKGKWIATHPDADPSTEGFYLPSFYAPVGWLSWKDIAKEYAEACLTSKGVDHDKMTTFYNTILGKKYRIGGDNSQKWRSLYEKARGSDLIRGVIPRWVNFLTSGADVQKDRIEVSIYGWGRLGHSLAVEHYIIPFDDEHDLEVPNSDAWQRYYDNTIGCVWEREDGLKMKTVANAIDSSYKQDCEFAFWNTLTGQDKERSFPIKGRDSLTGFTSLRRIGKLTGQAWWEVPVSSLKHHMFDHLDESMKQNTESSPYYMEFPNDYSDEYYMQLFAESWQQVGRKWQWVKTRNRNEILDCTVYNLAMYYHMGFGNFTGDEWDAIALEQQRAVEGRSNLSRITKKGRRMLSRGLG